MSFGFGFGFTKITAAIRAAFSPSSLFAANEPGVWYDPSDRSTLFQDAAGTVPVTAVEQPVGLMLDKSKGLVLGPELVTNGDFSNGLTGWTNAGNGTMVDNGGVLKYTRGSTTGVVNQTYGDSSTVNKWYQITARCRSVSGGGSASVRLSTAGGTIFGTSAAVTSSAWTDVVAYGVVPEGATGVVASLIVGTPSGTIAEFDNISVRELPGNHAYQTTATSRPVLSARYNLLTKTEQFDDAVWAKTNVTVTPNAAIAPNGTTTADEMTTNGVAGVQRVFQGATTTGALTFSVYAKATTARYLQLTYTSEPTVFANFDLLSGTVGTVGTGVTSNSITSVGNGWYQCTVSGNISAGSGSWAAYIIPASNSAFNAALTATVASIYIWGASLVPANQAHLPYQRVNTATDYDTAGFPHYLRFDGVDDKMTTAGIVWSAACDCFTAVQHTSGARWVDVWLTTDVGSGYWAVGQSGATNSPTGSSIGSPAYFVDGTALNPVTRGEIYTRCINQTRIVETRSLNLMANTGGLSIGGYAGYLLNGRLCGLVIAEGVTDAEARSVRRWLAGKAGVAL